ncbi:MAG TPA: PrgI family protein [Candidatus Paceibacterota bacterium]|nr:PrgI family protein [Candidatus Paceibacterota bacterium]
MQFQVPQFIDIEDKIVGPLTLKQFLYIAGTVALAYVAYTAIPVSAIGVLVAIGLLSFGGLLAFYKYNNRPFINIVAAAFFYYIRPRLYIWRPQKKTAEKKRVVDMSRYKTTKSTAAEASAPSSSRLGELNWKVDM